MASRLTCLQGAVRKAERLRLLGQVSGGLAHQLRNGVAGARLAVQVHARECAGRADPEALDVALRQLSLVEEKLQRFLHLGGSDRPCHQPCSLTGLVDEAVGLFRPQCRHTHIDLRWQPPAGALTIEGDHSQLGHLFVNLLGNAVEAVGSCGWIEVRVDTLAGEREEEPPGEQGSAAPTHARVEVSDSGPGPAPEVAGNLFDEFVTSKPEGVGLGLAVARQVAEAHGGRIDWQREQGRTCFRVVLPLAPVQGDHLEVWGAGVPEGSHGLRGMP